VGELGLGQAVHMSDQAVELGAELSPLRRVGDAYPVAPDADLLGQTVKLR
jgi:hypothetical protein